MFPKCLPEKVILEKIIHSAHCAPSPDNNQPWSFAVLEDRLVLCFDKTRSLTSDPKQMLNFVSLGMVSYNIQIAAAEEGYETSVNYNPDSGRGDEVVEFCFSKNAKRNPDYHYINRRRTNRSSYAVDKPLPVDFVKEMAALNLLDGIHLSIVEKREHIKELAKLAYKSDSARFSKLSAWNELLNSLVFSRKDFLKQRHGIYIQDLCLPLPIQWLFRRFRFPLVIKAAVKLGLVPVLMRGNLSLVLKSRAIGLITTNDFSKTSYIKAGEAFQKVWLAATRHGLSIHPICSYPVYSYLQAENPGDLPLKGLLKLDNQQPVVMFRLGYAKERIDTPPIRTSALLRTEWRSSAPKVSTFNYEEAFCRNIGLISDDELQLLKNKTVGIPGMGAVGGHHLMTLARMGIGGFHIADADAFSVSNFNRQLGAMTSTIGKNKVEVMEDLVRQVNPEIRLKCWREFLQSSNLLDFLSGCDLIVDSLDAFALESRRLLFAKAQEMRIPIISCGPLGFSCSMFIVLPDSMPFDEYINYKQEDPPQLNFLRFLLGVAPTPYFLKYMDTKRINENAQHGPSSAAAVALCAGFAGAEGLKILLGRARVRGIPKFHYFDPYLMKFKLGWMPFGGRNPLQKSRLKKFSRLMNRSDKNATIT